MITRISTLVVLCSMVIWGQTAQFPGAIATDQNLFVGYQPTFPPISLTIAMAEGDSSFSVNSCGSIGNNSLVQIEQEEIAVVSCASGVVTVASSPINGRGYDGTVAASHVPGNFVLLVWEPWMHNSLRVEVKAIEAALGTNLSGLTTTVNGISCAAGSSCSPVGAPSSIVSPPEPGTVTFNGSNGASVASFKITLTGNVTSSSWVGGTAGQIVIVEICQDSTGSRTFVFPTNFKGAFTIGATASKCNTQPFFFDGINLYAMSAGVTNE